MPAGSESSSSRIRTSSCGVLCGSVSVASYASGRGRGGLISAVRFETDFETLVRSTRVLEGTNLAVCLNEVADWRWFRDELGGEVFSRLMELVAGRGRGQQD